MQAGFAWDIRAAQRLFPLSVFLTHAEMCIEKSEGEGVLGMGPTGNAAAVLKGKKLAHLASLHLVLDHSNGLSHES